MARINKTEKQLERELERWYLFFLDVCKAAVRFDYGIACNPKQKQEMMDMMERVAEDPDWLTFGRDLPPLVVHRDVPDGQYMYVNKRTMETLSLAAALQSRKGLGRFSKLWTPNKGIERGQG